MEISIVTASALKENLTLIYVAAALMFCTMGLTSTWFREKCYKLRNENESNYISRIKCEVVRK